MAQLRTVANLPWVHGVAVMPDVHYGKGATVGSVIAMRDAVSPAAVGVDIGCGMTAVRTSLSAADLPDDLAGLRRRIEDAIPVGFSKHNRPVPTSRVPGAGGWDAFWAGFGELVGSVQQLRERALHQMGTLGGGNPPTCRTATWRCCWWARRRWTPTAGTCTGRGTMPSATGRRCSRCCSARSGRRCRRCSSTRRSRAITTTWRRKLTTASTSSSPARARSAPARPRQRGRLQLRLARGGPEDVAHQGA